MAEENQEGNVEDLSGTEKSAILMMLLGEDEAAQVLQKLTPQRGTASWYSNVFSNRCRSNYSKCCFG